MVPGVGAGLVVVVGFTVLTLGTVLAFLMQYPYATAGSLGNTSFTRRPRKAVGRL